METNFEFIEDNNEDFTDYINKDLAGTKTEQNLQDSFCGESKARNKYLIFSKQAEKDGFIQISRLFEETANNEAAHGKIWLKLLYGGKIPHTLKNLETAASAENYEWEDMYAKFAQDARDEGFDRIAYLFETIRTIEKTHMIRYNKLIKDLKTNTVFEKPEKIMWECGKCGFSFEGENAPKQCPFCKHPKAYFFEKCINY